MFSVEQLSDIPRDDTAGGTALAAHDGLMPKLRAIVCYGTGYDGVDLAASASQDRARPQPRARMRLGPDIAVTLMLAATRRCWRSDVVAAQRLASKPSPMMRPQAGMPPQDRVYGWGEIAQDRRAGAEFRDRGRLFLAAARRRAVSVFSDARALGMAECADDRGARRPRTHHALDANILNKLGKDGYVVNIARGSVIDQKALITAADDQTIAGAVLSYAKEPHAPTR